MPTDFFRDCLGAKCSWVWSTVETFDKDERNIPGQMASCLEAKDVAGFTKLVEDQPPHIADKILEAPGGAVPVTEEFNSFPDSTGWWCTCGQDPESPWWRRFWIAMWWFWMVLVPLAGGVTLVTVGVDCADLQEQYGSNCSTEPGNYIIPGAFFFAVFFFNALSRFPICGVHYFWFIWKWPAKSFVAVDLSNVTISPTSAKSAGSSSKTLLERGKMLVKTLKKDAGLIKETAKALDNLLDGGNERRRESLEERGADKADALESANAIVEQDTMKYRMAYKNLLDADGGVARAEREGFDEAAAGIKTSADKELRKYPNSKVQQPEIAGVDRFKQKGKYVTQSNKRFKSAMPSVLTAIMAIAAAAGGEVHVGPPKTNERLFEKARLSYGGDLERVTDYVRLSIVCTTFEQLKKVLLAINLDFIIIRIKNRFAKANEVAKDTGAYRDCQLNLLIPGTKLVIEVQLHLDVIYELKSKVAGARDADGRTGHDRYIEFRLLKETADHTFGDVE